MKGLQSTDEIECTVRPMTCIHPVACWTGDGADAYCRWCEEVKSLTGQIAAITEQIHAKAVIVNGGSLSIEGDVGYLAVYDGSVSLKSMTCSDVRSDVAYREPSSGM